LTQSAFELQMVRPEAHVSAQDDPGSWAELPQQTFPTEQLKGPPHSMGLGWLFTLQSAAQANLNGVTGFCGSVTAQQCWPGQSSAPSQPRAMPPCWVAHDAAQIG
jgi:hypothetical protein